MVFFKAYNSNFCFTFKEYCYLCSILTCKTNLSRFINPDIYSMLDYNEYEYENNQIYNNLYEYNIISKEIKKKLELLKDINKKKYKNYCYLFYYYSVDLKLNLFNKEISYYFHYLTKFNFNLYIVNKVIEKKNKKLLDMIIKNFCIDEFDHIYDFDYGSCFNFFYEDNKYINLYNFHFYNINDFIYIKAALIGWTNYVKDNYYAYLNNNELRDKVNELGHSDVYQFLYKKDKEIKK